MSQTLAMQPSPTGHAQAAPSRGPRSAAPAIRLAYLTTQYPEVSHTFIRREIQQLEAAGQSVLRLSIRPPPATLVHPVDRGEAEKTLSCLGEPKWKLLAAFAGALLRRPAAVLSALRLAVRMGRRSDRGVLRHLAYVVEACHLLAVVRRHRIQHIHVHFGTNSAAVARLIRRLGGPPYSMTVHGPDEFDAPIAFDLGGKVRDAVFVAAISRFCRAQLCRWSAPEDWPKIKIVRCGIAPDFGREIGDVPPDSVEFLTIGRLNAQKGQLMLLEAARRLHEAGERFTVTIAGDGELRAVLEARIRQLGLQEVVTITGYLPESGIRECLARCRALVMASFAEGLPVVVMEALAAARPVIATAIAGLPELVRPGENGWLVPAGDEERLAEAMRAVLHLPVGRLHEMGRAGRELVFRQHDAAAEAARLLQHFQDACPVLENKDPP
ncbi:MAG: colanic acid biosynthesis glycosyltransferase WcaL [Phycisphaerae bacterium]|jgi:glycosyltransferase involved in cell wall biosynthesis